MSHSVLKDFYYSIFPDNSKYLTFKTGKTNIILSAPHGGNMRPLNIPYRTRGNRSRDTYTRRLIQRVIELMYKKPYYIYSDIHRSRVDLNRDIIEAANGNPKAEAIWRDWNNALNSYTDNVRKKFTKGLYVDIHSHSNSDKFHIGYGLGVRSYLSVMEGKTIIQKSTMQSLRLNGLNEFPTLFGNGSFPHMFKSYGFKVLTPVSEATFLNGGRNIKEFSGNGIGALQIECPISTLTDRFEEVATVLAYSIESYTERFCNDSID